MGRPVQLSLKKGTSSSIKTGLNQTNLIGVVAKGSSIDVYVNLMHVDSATDNTISQGLLGVVAIELASLDIRLPLATLYRNAGVPQTLNDPEGEV